MAGFFLGFHYFRLQCCECFLRVIADNFGFELRNVIFVKEGTRGTVAECSSSSIVIIIIRLWVVVVFRDLQIEGIFQQTDIFFVGNGSFFVGGDDTTFGFVALSRNIYAFPCLGFFE